MPTAASNQTIFRALNSKFNVHPKDVSCETINKRNEKMTVEVRIEFYINRLTMINPTIITVRLRLKKKNEIKREIMNNTILVIIIYYTTASSSSTVVSPSSMI